MSQKNDNRVDSFIWHLRVGNIICHDPTASNMYTMTLCILNNSLIKHIRNPDNSKFICSNSFVHRHFWKAYLCRHFCKVWY